MRDNHTDIERQRQIYRPTDTDTYTLREDINKDRSRGRETDRYNWTYTERDKQRQCGVTCFHRAGFAYGAIGRWSMECPSIPRRSMLALHQRQLTLRLIPDMRSLAPLAGNEWPSVGELSSSFSTSEKRTAVLASN